MAMDFGASSTTTLTDGTSVTHSVGFKTICCWFKADTLTGVHTMISEDWVGGGGPYYCRLGVNASGQITWAIRTLSANSNWIYTTTTSIGTGEWAHACLVVGGSNDARVFLNGGGASTLPAFLPLNGSAPDETTIGGVGSTNTFDGLIGWACTYAAKLTDTEIAILAAGAHPSMVRPSALKLFWPLGWLNGENTNDIWSSTTVTTVGTPTWSDSIPAGLIYPSQQIIGVSQGIITPPPQHNQRQILLKNKMSIQNSRLLIGK